MSDQAFGWIVEVTDRAGARKYHVAVKDRVEAEGAGRRRLLGAATHPVEAVTMLAKRAVTVRLLSVPARGVRRTLGLVDGSGPQQPDPSTARDAGVTLVSPLSTALAGLVMVRIAVGSGLQQPANPETDHDHRQTAPCGAYREGL